MDLDDWIEKYKPIANPRNDTSFSITGDDGKDQCLMFETYGEDFTAVEKAYEKDPRTVWTWIECDEIEVIGSGFHWVNRLGYFITEVPLEDDIHSLDISLED